MAGETSRDEAAVSLSDGTDHSDCLHFAFTPRQATTYAATHSGAP